MKEEAALLKPVLKQTVPFGVDPKTVLCVYFKAGHCEKAGKCKFSHDLNVGRKVEKKNLYEDSREEKLAGVLSFFTCCGFLLAHCLHRYDGHLGRRETSESCIVESWKPQDHHRRSFAVFLFYQYSDPVAWYRSYASILFKPSNLRSRYSPSCRGSVTHWSFQIRMVLGVSKWRAMPIQTRPPPRFRP
jgi:hypothetical protein